MNMKEEEKRREEGKEVREREGVGGYTTVRTHNPNTSPLPLLPLLPLLHSSSFIYCSLGSYMWQRPCPLPHLLLRQE